MGNSQELRVRLMQVCCHKGICSPSYEITFQEYESRSRATPSPTLKQEFLKSLVADPDSQLTSQDTNRIEKLTQISPLSAKLKIVVIASSTVKPGTEYLLSPLGYCNSKRQAKDGFCYFGAKKNFYASGRKTTVNDIIFPLDSSVIEKHRGQHFCIYFDLLKDSYVIKDFSLGFGTFFKLNDMIIVKNNFLLFMGEHYFLFNLIDAAQTLKVKVFSPAGDESTYEFIPDEYDESCVKIGRGSFCDIVINDTLASKVQCCVSYSQSWVLVDGDGEKTSTNGVWIYINEPLEIQNGMIFKSNHTIFQSTHINPEPRF